MPEIGDWHHGKCHVCKLDTWVLYCSMCNHWFCNSCKDNWTQRTVEAIIEKAAGRLPGCCGRWLEDGKGGWELVEGAKVATGH